MKKLIFSCVFIILLAACTHNTSKQVPVADSTVVAIDSTSIEPTTVTDIDGNVYKTVTIGNQVWMAENLRVTHYQNGDPIPNITDGSEWGELNTGAYCDYNNKMKNGNLFGHLYNWYAVTDNRSLAPKGWHIPTIDEWNTLFDYVRSAGDASTYLKSTKGWKKNGSNSSGFTALPSGERQGLGFGEFYGIDTLSGFWSSSPHGDADGEPLASEKVIGYEFESNEYEDLSASYNSGISVRCIKDSPSSSQNNGKAKENNITINNSLVTIPFYAEKEDNKFISSSSNILYKQELHECKFFLKKQFIPNGKSWTYKGCEVTAFNKKSNSSYTITEVPTSVFLSGNTVSTFFGSNGQVYTYPDRKLFGTGRLVLEEGDAFQFVLDLFGTVRYEGKIYFIEK